MDTIINNCNYFDLKLWLTSFSEIYNIKIITCDFIQFVFFCILHRRPFNIFSSDDILSLTSHSNRVLSECKFLHKTRTNKSEEFDKRNRVSVRGESEQSDLQLINTY